MADTSVVDLNADFVGLWWSDLDVLNGEIFTGLPGNGGLYNSKILVIVVIEFILYLASNSLRFFVSIAS